MKWRAGHHRRDRHHHQLLMSPLCGQVAALRDPVVLHNSLPRPTPRHPSHPALHPMQAILAPIPGHGQQENCERTGEPNISLKYTSISMADIQTRQSVSSIATAVPQALPETTPRPAFPVMIQSPVSQMSMQPITAHPPNCTNCGHNQPAILIYLPFGLPAQPVAYTGTGGGPVYVVQPTQPAPVNMPPPQEFPRAPNPSMQAITVPMGGCASDTTGLGTLHECNCGPGCQCLGCIAHPFNDATREYIRSAQNAFDDFGTPYQSLQDLDSANMPTAQSIANLTLSPEQTLASEDFFFVDYPSAQRVYPG